MYGARERRIYSEHRTRSTEHVNMIYTSKEEFISQIGKGGQLLGVDIGSKTLGLAISDSTLTIATPLKTINRKKFTLDIKILEDILKQNSIAGIVVGLPLGMDGKEGPATQSVRQFVRNFLKEYDYPVIFQDERMSTSAVERTLLDADMSRAKRGEVIDKMAASYILQGFLDGLKK